MTSNGFKETNKQKPEYFDRVINLSKNLKNAKYIGRELPKHEHKYNVDYFSRLHGQDVDYLVAHNADSGRNFFHKVTGFKLASPKLEAQSLYKNIIPNILSNFKLPEFINLIKTIFQK